MKIFKHIFYTLYRIWFYVLVTIPILIMFPFLVVSILKESWYPYFFKMARLWSWFILIGMGFRVKIEREQIPQKNESYMFVANHTSMADIMLMLVTVKNPFVFVGKAELAKIPLFGFFYKRTSILVDRNDAKSRQTVFLRAQRRLKQGMSICIFPEGGVPDKSIVLDPFKDGAFRMAINHQIPIVPITFGDNKKRFSYIFLSGSPGEMRAKVHRFISTKGLSTKDTKDINKQAHQLLLDQLNTFNNKTIKHKKATPGTE